MELLLAKHSLWAPAPSHRGRLLEVVRCVHLSAREGPSSDRACDHTLKSGGRLRRLAVGSLELAGRLCTAVFQGNVVMLRRLLHAGAPPGTADYDGRTCLHIAAAEGNLGAVRPICSVSPSLACSAPLQPLQLPRLGSDLCVGRCSHDGQQLTRAWQPQRTCAVQGREVVQQASVLCVRAGGPAAADPCVAVPGARADRGGRQGAGAAGRPVGQVGPGRGQEAGPPSAGRPHGGREACLRAGALPQQPGQWRRRQQQQQQLQPGQQHQRAARQRQPRQRRRQRQRQQPRGLALCAFCALSTAHAGPRSIGGQCSCRQQRMWQQGQPARGMASHARWTLHSLKVLDVLCVPSVLREPGQISGRLHATSSSQRARHPACFPGQKLRNRTRCSCSALSAGVQGDDVLISGAMAPA